MTDRNHNKDTDKGGVSPVVTAVAGAVVGAGVAVAGAIALKNEKNREKVKEALTNVKDRAVGYIEDAQKQTEVKKDEIEEKLAEGKEKIEKAAKAAKASLDSI